MAVPNHFGLPERFKENLEFLGFKVFLLKNYEHVTIPLKDKIIHAYNKWVHKDKSYKRLLKNKMSKEKQLALLSTFDKADYALFIRPDLFDYDVVNATKEKVDKIVAYQWDGIKRYPLVKNYIALFDKFYAFDKNDVKENPNLHSATNFYFDDIKPTKEVEKGTVFFLGTYMRHRLTLLQHLGAELISRKLIPRFFLLSKRRRRSLCEVKIISKGFSFKQSIELMQKSEFLLDLHNAIHNGLSFRTFESIGYNKKLITDNKLVRDYDFYNPNNIFVFEDNNFKGLETFIKAPYQQVDTAIKQKYSFTGWLQKILE